ncbi:TPA: RES family NAD+ phosphorylase [Photobacterium damselae]
MQHPCLTIYRVTKEQYINQLNGYGGSKTDGRWHPKGSLCIYFGLSAAGSMLEMANYIPDLSLAADMGYKIAAYKIPAELLDEFSEKDLPDNWDQMSHGIATQQIGKNWLESNVNVGLILPSAAVPGGLEKIALINPLHPRANEIKLVKVFDLKYDERMISKTSNKKT